jgi:hypothetical protein
MDELFDLTDVTGGYDMGPELGPRQAAAERLNRCTEDAGREVKDVRRGYNWMRFVYGAASADVYAWDAQDRYEHQLSKCLAEYRR